MPNADRALCWLRRDLRLLDHAALAAATDAFSKVAVAFVFDTNILDALADNDDRRVTFIHRSLQEVDARLRDHGSHLVVLHGDPALEIPKLAKAMGATKVFAGRDYEPYARQRDTTVDAALRALDISFETVKDSVVFEAGEILSQGGAPFRVFTPYARAWRARLGSGAAVARHEPDLSRLLDTQEMPQGVADWSLEKLGFTPVDLWLEPGQEGASLQLAEFMHRIEGYAEQRNFPARNGTSGLSVHLRFGTISIRQACRAALAQGGPGAEQWLSEIAWRDFYQDILAHNPRVVDMPFQAQCEKLDYPGSDEHFDVWCAGQTGYPIVDAAMRCLLQTGWMHNRLRMVVASFLTKDLLVDYRKGEAWFARYLLDFELASNNGGWQWAASTGADPQPYFRVFNPSLQSRKFDPGAQFIRRWVPELASLPNEFVHEPQKASAMDLLAAGVELGKNYPFPIVQHDVQRKKAIELLKGTVRSTE